jgi:hypothetical protein
MGTFAVALHNDTGGGQELKLAGIDGGLLPENSAKLR